LQAINPGTQSPFLAACPSGTRPFGGGWETFGGAGAQLSLVASLPFENGSTGWRVVLRNNSAAQVTTTIRVHVVCAVAQ
jgi:hypothetical protein